MSVTKHVPATREERRYLDFEDPTHGLYLTRKLIRVTSYRSIVGAYGIVHCAHFEDKPEDRVAVKEPRCLNGEDWGELNVQALEKEITFLKLVRHPNILPLLGLVRYGDSCHEIPRIVTPWMKNGSLRKYLSKIEPDADRLDILTDVATAVQYLHSGAGLPQTSFVIHGDIHAGNVLISDEGKALLADFGLSKRVLVDEQTSLSLRPVGRTPGLASYMAPELRDVPDAPRSLCSDVFAFGMLIYETYAEFQLDPKLPPTRASISRRDMTDAIWKVACDCWAHQPSKRPSMNDVITMLGRARPDVHWHFPSDFILKGVYEAEPGLPPCTVGYFDTVLISRPKLSLRSTVLAYLLRVLNPAAGDSENALVAIHYMRNWGDSRNSIMDEYDALEKAMTPLKHCDHPNIARVLGLWQDPFVGDYAVVSQFADQGKLFSYMRLKPGFPVLTKILHDVAAGLGYLHKRRTGKGQIGIVHGDLNPFNVLIMTDGMGVKAVLCNFWRCEIIDAHGMTSIAWRPDGIEGISGYLGPELYLEGDLGRMVHPQVMQTDKYSGRRTVKGDVFAFGMLSFTTLGGDVCRALCGGEAKLNPVVAIAISIVEGRRPSRQDLVLAEDHKVYDGDVDKYWPSIEACWQGDAAKRPAIEDVRDKIPRVLQEKP